MRDAREDAVVYTLMAIVAVSLISAALSASIFFAILSCLCGYGIIATGVALECVAKMGRAEWLCETKTFSDGSSSKSLKLRIRGAILGGIVVSVLCVFYVGMSYR